MERFPFQHILDHSSALSSPAPSTPASHLNSPQVVRVSGRSISVLENDDDNDNGATATTTTSQAQSSGSQTTSPGDSPPPSTQQQQGIPLYYRGDTESEGESESENDEFTGQFVFARNIAQPNDVLTGPPLIERKYSNNLKEIEVVTGTECCLVPNSKASEKKKMVALEDSGLY